MLYSEVALQRLQLTTEMTDYESKSFGSEVGMQWTVLLDLEHTCSTIKHPRPFMYTTRCEYPGSSCKTRGFCLGPECRPIVKNTTVYKKKTTQRK